MKHEAWTCPDMTAVFGPAAASCAPYADPEWDAKYSRRLEDLLESFRIPARVHHVDHGPAATRFCLEPDPGVKVTRVAALRPQICLALESAHLHIDAPIAGTSLIGLEIPAANRTPVLLAELMDCAGMENASSLTFPLGRDLSGKPVLCSLPRLPHLLIAGSAGSGKSVCIGCMLTAFLLRCSPAELKLMLIDVQHAELAVYSDIPHLICPVITEAREALHALQWAVDEMIRRCACLQEAGAHSITKYNEKAAEKLPRLVIVIDELAPLMMAHPLQAEECIVRLAQMGPVCGVHLVITTQRVSANPALSLISALIPSRIAFRVGSDTESKFILNRSGAEELCCPGDMLFSSMEFPAPRRLQGAFVPPQATEALTDALRMKASPEFDSALTEALKPSGEPE